MPNFRTCHTCAIPGSTCETRAKLAKALAGLGVVSLKHRCPSYTPAFTPGEAVKVETFAWPVQDEDPAPKRWFPGHFIKLVRQRALVFVPKGALALGGSGEEFEPLGKGYLKVPLARVAARDAEPVNVTACRWCAAIPVLDGYCGQDPHYTPSGDCLALHPATPALSGPQRREVALSATDEPLLLPSQNKDADHG